MSVGLLTVIMHIIMIVLQMVLLGRKFQWHQWLQLPVGMIFGLLIDTLMWTTQSWSIEYYGWQMLACLSSCLITALGVCLIIKASLVFLAGEGLYLAVSQRFNINFGSCKTYGDIVLVAFAVISGWLALGYSAGVREGTVITALLVGTLVKKILPKLNFIQLTKA